MRALETVVCIICIVFCLLFVPGYYRYKEKQESTNQANNRKLEELSYEVEQSGRLSLEMLYYLDVVVYAYDKDMIMVSWSEICDEIHRNGFYDFRRRQDRYVVIQHKGSRKYIRLT